MLPPDSPFKKWWNRVVVLLVMYNTLFIIIVICFNKYRADGLYWYDAATDTLDVTPMVFDYLVDVFFAADIYLTFRTTFFDQENELVLDRKVISRTYLKSWFPVRRPHDDNACCDSAGSSAHTCESPLIQLHMGQRDRVPPLYPSLVCPVHLGLVLFLPVSHACFRSTIS